jgi:hypothetical protein
LDGNLRSEKEREMAAKLEAHISTRMNQSEAGIPEFVGSTGRRRLCDSEWPRNRLHMRELGDL